VSKHERRLTPKERKAREIASIRARIEDMARGASGGARVEDDPDGGVFVAQTLNLTDLDRWIDAIRLTFWPDGLDLRDWGMHFGPHALGNF